jgi:Na+/phosphate symporter
MGDTVEALLSHVMTASMNNDRKLAGDVSRMDNIVDRLTEAIKLYIARLTRGSLDEREGRRAMEIVSSPACNLPLSQRTQLFIATHHKQQWSGSNAISGDIDIATASGRLHRRDYNAPVKERSPPK